MTRRQRRRLRRTALALCLALSLQIVPVDTGAIPAINYPSNCAKTVRYEFTGNGWTQHRKDIVADAIDDWEDARDKHDTPWIVITDTGPTEIEISWEAVPGVVEPGDPIPDGAGSCDGGYLQLRDTFMNDDAKIQKIARHEMGHVLGLDHTGDTDSHDSHPEAIGVCPVPTYGDRLSQDDAGQLAHENGYFDPPSISANLGFELGTDYWTEQDTSLFTTITDPKFGALSLAFKKQESGTSALIYQTMNNAGSASMKVDTKLHYKKQGISEVDGSLFLQLLSREVEYNTTNSGCGLPGPGSHKRTKTVACAAPVPTPFERSANTPPRLAGKTEIPATSPSTQPGTASTFACG